MSNWKNTNWHDYCLRSLDEQIQEHSDVLDTTLMQRFRDAYAASPEESRQALGEWTRYGFERINPYLRQGRIPKKADPYHIWDLADARAQAAGLDAVMCETAVPMTVYRGIRFHERALRPLWREPAFVSTSWDRDVAERFARIAGGMKLTQRESIKRWSHDGILMQINLPAGHPVCPVGLTPHEHGVEREIILGRGTVFRLVSRRRPVRGMTVVTLEASHEGRIFSPASSVARRTMPRAA